jgi:6-pyruvoyltetrahydropterin/6-carboxytetrahydropterin synthase
MAIALANAQTSQRTVTQGKRVMLKIYQRFTFDAAHRLPDWPDLHGHSYTVELWFEGPTVEGYVIPAKDLANIAATIKQKLDHRFLNDIIPIPTSENIALFIWDQLADRQTRNKVVVYRESCGMGVEYSGEIDPGFA